MTKWTTYFSRSTKSQSGMVKDEMKKNGKIGEHGAIVKIGGMIAESIILSKTTALSHADIGAQSLLCSLSYMAAVKWHRGRGTHLFLPTGMARFLIDAVRELDSTDLKGTAIEPLSLANSESLCGPSGPFFIHVPKDECLHQSREKNNEGFNIEKGSLCYFYDSGAALDNSIIYLCTNDCGTSILNKNEIAANFTGNKNTSIAMRLFIGISLYVDAFPDALQEFMPHAIEWNGTGRRCYGLKPSKEVQEDIDHSVSPHYRRGHMRLLSSERYTEEKRGKAVFVKGCFVKGKAYEVVG